jgi:hypothetical protein
VRKYYFNVRPFGERGNSARRAHHHLTVITAAPPAPNARRRGLSTYAAVAAGEGAAKLQLWREEASQPVSLSLSLGLQWPAGERQKCPLSLTSKDKGRS